MTAVPSISTHTFVPTFAVPMARPSTSTAGAGAACASTSTSTAVVTMESTGDNILREYCEDYETATKSSYLLPPLVLSKYPEERIPGPNPTVPGTIPRPPRILLKKEEDHLKGITIEQRGEMAEKEVFNLIHELSHNTPTEQFIALKDIDLDNNNSSHIKEMELKNELPKIDLSLVNMKGEHDFIVIIRNVGVIVMEVKTTTAGKNIEKAEKQLKNSKALVQAIMGGVEGTGTSFLPVEKVMIFPNELTPSPSSMTPESSHRVHKDLLSQLSTVFNDIVSKLKSVAIPSITTANFDRFTRILIGFWCLTPMKPGFDFNKSLASTVSLVQEVDRRVDQQEISSFKMSSRLKQPVSDVEYCPPGKISRTCKEIGAIFLTPQQKNILDNFPQAMIIGAAGTGKTLISLLKCVDIIEKNPTDKISLVVPPPHDIRCQMILQSNNVPTKIIEKFPPDDVNSSSVFIIQVQKFFGVSVHDLFAYNLSSFHLLMDDIQSYINVIIKKFVVFEDIAKFVDTQYIIAGQQHKHFWCCFDVTQVNMFENEYRAPTSLLFDAGGQRPYNIPIMQLNKVLRNSSNIIPLTLNLREKWIDGWKKYSKLSNAQFSSVKPGHNITGEPVIFHFLKVPSSKRQHDTDFILKSRENDDINKNQREPFILQMIENELNILLKEKPAYRPSDVAILESDDIVNKPYDTTTIRQFVKQKFGITCHTVKQSIQKKNTKCIVLDQFPNIMSYEVPCVVLIISGWPNIYSLASRARSRLSVIDSSPYASDAARPPTEHATMITWEKQNGAFVKVKQA